MHFGLLSVNNGTASTLSAPHCGAASCRRVLRDLDRHLAATLLALGLSLTTSPSSAVGPDADAPKAFLFEHGEYRVPAGSPLRGRLVVAAVEQRQDSPTITVPGQVEALPSHTVNVLSPLTGRVIALRVELGDVVRKGQLLAVIASGDLAQAYADLDKARDALALAQKTAIRTAGVEKTGAAAAKDSEAASSAVTQADAEYQRARLRLAALDAGPGGRTGTRNLSIVAPIGGTVTALSIGNGSVVGDLTAALMTVTDTSMIWVTANVAENQIGDVRSGQRATVRFAAYPGESVDGTVSAVGAVLAPDTRRLPVRIILANPAGRMKPNMFATVALAGPTASSVRVPQSALLMNNDSTTVLVERAPGVFVRRAVELGRDEGTEVRVLSGVQAGERVVVRGGVLLND